AARIAEAVRDAGRGFIRESVLPACLTWLRDRGYWAEGESSEARALAEIAGGLDGLAPFEPELPAPVATVKNRSWIVPAAPGAALGAVALTPLAYLLLGSREIGLFVGGVAGAAGLVALVGVVASKPEVIAGLEGGLKWVGFIALPVGLWRGVRGRPTGWLR